jgi:hypothetical protein
MLTKEVFYGRGRETPTLYLLDVMAEVGQYLSGDQVVFFHGWVKWVDRNFLPRAR